MDLIGKTDQTFKERDSILTRGKKRKYFPLYEVNNDL